MSLLEALQPGVRLLDKQRGLERLVRAVERLGRVVKIWFDAPRTGGMEPFIYPVAEAEQRFEILKGGTAAFQAESEIVRLVAECYRLAHAYLFNPLFATETSLIDPLPHQLIAVYDHMLQHPRLRYLLADDAGAGKTIMAGLYIREMLLRRLVERVLIVPPAGLVGNWERELRNLFRLRFRIVGSGDGASENPLEDPKNDLAIVSVDTLTRPRMRGHMREARPYDLVVFDEAHKLSAYRDADLTVRASKRYEMAEEIAAQGRHLMLLTATPHMGKDDPYYFLWRLLEPELLSTPEAFNRLSRDRRTSYALRRMKEEMVRFDGEPIYPPRDSITVEYPLSADERELYEKTTEYCELHWNRAKLRNRGAAGLAMSVLQRRLASSTWALLRSFERREAKLTEELRLLEQGLISAEDLEIRQQQLPQEDVRDTKTGDEEEIEDGREESERNDEEIVTATDAVSPEELCAEIAEVQRLVSLARRVYETKRESKFEKLWDALKAYPDTKVLVFTEHRDTLDFLVGRLEALGLTGKITTIHGGMDYKDRDRAAEFFRDPDGARYLVATDAAGEGINLQFCWLLVNYDIPWNPARIEQRMGRVHRYKQHHEVLLLNMVAAETREGRVLKVLLDKLERIRKELGNDKVFDVIGAQFGDVALRDLIFRAVVEGQDEEVVRTIDSTLTRDQVEHHLTEQRSRVECSEVRQLLDSLQERREDAEVKRMMPSYVRAFFAKAAPHAGVGLAGDLDGVFFLDPCPDSVRRAMQTYPDEIQDKLTFSREIALPPDALSPRAIYLHPGEPVFEAVTTLFLGKAGELAMHGGVFYDGAAKEPYLFYLGKVPVLKDRIIVGRDGGDARVSETVEEVMVGVRRFGDDRCEEVPAHLLLDLFESEEGDEVDTELLEVWSSRARDRTAVETFIYEKHGVPALERSARDAEQRCGDRQKQLRRSYSLYEAELLEQRRRLKEAVAKGEPASRHKLKTCEQELESLDGRRSAAESSLLMELDSLRMGPVTLFATALVLPLPPGQTDRRRDDQVELTAVRVAREHEEKHGAFVEDLSDPTKKMGFDLRSLRSDGEVRYIEVKGRARVGSLELTENEWAQAQNHPDRYWLYVVYNCETTPVLRRIKDPAGKGIGRPKGGVTIDAIEVLATDEEDGA
jgi:superfamily II DNA or RNA helicase